jgi:hypothetical protein
MDDKPSRTTLGFILLLLTFAVTNVISQDNIKTNQLRIPAFRVNDGARPQSVPIKLPDTTMADRFKQSDPQTRISKKNEIMIWGGFSPDSTTALPSAATKDARFGIVGVRYARRFNNSRFLNLKYTAEFYPVAILNFPDRGVRKTARGIGFSPLGLQMNLRPHKIIQPFVGISGGAISFNKSVPNELGRKFNFTAVVSGGVEFLIKKKRSVTVGYKLFHISNAGLGEVNPAFDDNVIYAGYSFLF